MVTSQLKSICADAWNLRKKLLLLLLDLQRDRFLCINMVDKLKYYQHHSVGLTIKSRSIEFLQHTINHQTTKKEDNKTSPVDIYQMY